MFLLKNIQYKNILNIKELKIFPGKITCIVGESGSGKTTLLKLLNNMIACEKGEILFNGKSLYEIDPINLRRRVVMLPQNPIVFDGSVKDNLLIGLKFSEKPFLNDRELVEVLKEMKLNKELASQVEQLSGGEKQRLSLGRVLIMEPDILLLDEPSSALDEETEELIMKNIVSYIKKNKKTLVMVTHARKIAEQYGEIIIEVRNGQIIN